MACEWYFDELSNKDSRQGDIPTKHAFDANIEIFVREVLQNANDAGPVHPDEPVEVTFRFNRFDQGDGLKEFKDTFRWDEQFSPHLVSAAEEEQDLSLQQFLQNETDQLITLTVEDKNTEGLSGPEDADESNYTALVRDMHRSNKDETQGGSHGVGGTVLWAFSGVSTVFFTSHPEGSDKAPRFVGRSYLPDHTIEEDLYKGYGWFGVPDQEDPTGRYVSAWGAQAEEISQLLGAGRPDELGTSLTVVGFREPGEPQPTGDQLDQTVERIKKAAVENFWPAIRRQQLRVYVKGPDDESRRPADFETVETVSPFVKAYEQIRTADEPLGEPGNTATKSLSFEFPDRSDGTETPDEADVTLAVRTAGPSEEDLRNKVAVFRGSGMIVQYVDMEDVAKYGADFHAVLVCGQARTELDATPSFVDQHVEELLRAAEPAAHDSWTGTPRLKNKYSGRRVGTVKDLQGGALRDALRELVSSDDSESGERLDSFEKLFPIGSRDRGRESSSKTETVSTPGPIDREISRLEFNDGHWAVDVTLTRDDDDDGPWAAKVWLVRLFESGGDGERLHIEDVINVDGKNVTDSYVDETGTLVVESECPETVRIECRSESRGPPDPTSGRTARTGVRHELVENEGSS